MTLAQPYLDMHINRTRTSDGDATAVAILSVFKKIETRIQESSAL